MGPKPDRSLLKRVGECQIALSEHELAIALEKMSL